VGRSCRSPIGRPWWPIWPTAASRSWRPGCRTMRSGFSSAPARYTGGGAAEGCVRQGAAADLRLCHAVPDDIGAARRRRVVPRSDDLVYAHEHTVRGNKVRGEYQCHADNLKHGSRKSIWVRLPPGSFGRPRLRCEPSAGPDHAAGQDLIALSDPATIIQEKALFYVFHSLAYSAARYCSRSV
jgi:hypothetical protein